MPSSILNTLHGHGWSRSGHTSANTRSGLLASAQTVTSSTSISPQRSTGRTDTGNTLSPSTSAKSATRPDELGLKLKFRLESAPIVMYGPPNESSGALIGGILDLHVAPSDELDVIELTEASMSVIQEINYFVPAQLAQKLQGQTKLDELATWNVLQHSHTYKRGACFGYPFSHLLPGALPPTCSCKLFTIRYYLRAFAREASTGRTVETQLDINIGRSVVHQGEKTSVRVFPPTELSLSMVLPTNIYQNSTISAEMRLEGLSGTPDAKDHNRLRRWQVKRVNWRVDESVKVSPPAENGGEEGALEEKQTLAYGQHKSGWKTDYHTHNGILEMLTPDLCPGALAHACKDVSDPVSGLYVNHTIVIEVLIAEEVLQIRPPQRQGMLTGNARILRMQFTMPVTDRPGLGISWDAEVPPTYADVPLSPPTYASSVLDSLPSFEEVQNMPFSPALSPLASSSPSPTMRHIDPTIRGPEGSNNVPLSRLRLTDPSTPSLVASTTISASPQLRPFASAPPSSATSTQSRHPRYPA